MEVTMLSRYFNTENGGIGRYSKELLGRMIDNGVKVNPVQTLSEGALGYLYYTYLGLFGDLNFFNKGSDIYHALTPMEAIHTPEDKTVTTFHDLIPILHPDKQNWHSDLFASSFREFVGKKTFRFACKKALASEKIIANSKQTKKNLVENFNVEQEKIEVIRLGISENLKPIMKDFDNYRIGTLSYLSPRKRIRILIKEFKKINREDAKLIIGGKGEQLPKLKKIAGDDDRIIFKGYIPEGEMNEFYNSLDVFVFPTILEGYGLPAVEAMATATPVITLEDAIIPKDIKSRTCVVPKNELSSVLENKEYKVNIEKNLEFADLHDWNRNYRKTSQIYEEVVQ